MPRKLPKLIKVVPSGTSRIIFPPIAPWVPNLGVPEVAGVQARRKLASQNARHVQKVKSETRKKSGFAKRRPRKYRVLGRSRGKLRGALRKKKIDLRNCINFLKVIFEMSRAICPSKPSKSDPRRDIEDNISADVLVGAFCVPRCPGSFQN